MIFIREINKFISKCILQLRGVRPFFSDKFDITKHPKYKYLSDADPKDVYKRQIPDGKGGWKNHREDTTNWNDKGNVEIWRAAWAACTNRALESAGRPERIDHRSYKRQGIDKIPSVHLGPAASQMENRGIRTDKGEVNRQIAADNKLLKEIKARITRLYRWSKAETEKPQRCV